jgi:polyhydroxyalkanoate synthesis repressor PhaR
MARARKTNPAPAASEVDTPDANTASGGPRVLKKYPNRRLYDTHSSSYITLADVKAMVLSAQVFEVRDAKTNEDLTRSILLQIILEEEGGGLPIFSNAMLAQIIKFYGNSMQGMMGHYLEKNLQVFSDMQNSLADKSKGLFDPTTQTSEVWAQFLTGQAPDVKNLMSGYVEQSQNMFQQMQAQILKQAESLFPGVPGISGLIPPKE